MRTMKKLMVLVLSILMVLGTSVVSAFAADITVNNATRGQSYKAYKIFNAVYSEDGEGVVYTVPASLEEKVSAPFSVSTAKAKNNEKIVVLADGTTPEAVIAWAKANYDKFDSTGTALTYDANTGTAKATGLAAGYYYVTSSLGTVITLESVNDTATVVDKNESTPNGPEKNITAEDGTSIQATDANDAAVGSTESFTVTFNATNWVQSADDDTEPDSATPDDNIKVTEWNFTDTPIGLDIDKATVKVFVNDQEVTNIPAANITKSDAGVLSIKIPWVDANGASLYEAKTEGSALIPVKITYDAKVTADAATAVAPNTVVVKYNGNQDLGNDTTNTYTYKFQLDKVDEDNKPLTGAKFQLQDAAGNAIYLVATEDGYRKATSASETGAVDTIDLTTVASKVISGLDKASYKLVETTVPDGYTKAADETIADTQLTRVDKTLPTTAAVIIKNEPGTELPSTGGMGTTILYIVGGLLVVGCGIMLVAKKKADK